MQIVIDIPDRIHYGIEKDITVNGSKASQILIDAVKNGILLPKEHGRLIDGDKFDVISYQHINDDFDNGVMWLAEQIDNAPTIIEADKGDG